MKCFPEKKNWLSIKDNPIAVHMQIQIVFAQLGEFLQVREVFKD